MTLSTSSINRRNFLITSGATGVFLGLTGKSSFASDEKYQYIVIGSGAGGGPVCANLAKAGKKIFNLILRAFYDNFNPSIRTIAHPAREVKVLRKMKDGIAKADSLNDS